MKLFFLFLLLPLQLLAQPDSLWTRTYFRNSTAACYMMEPTPEGGYLLAGTRDELGMFLLKTAPNGDSLWSRTYAMADDFIGYWAHQTFDGGYALAGRYGSVSHRREAYMLVKTDAQGETLWTHQYKSTFHFNRCFSATQTADSGFALAGMIAYGDSYDEAALIWLVKTNAQGDSLWSRIYTPFPQTHAECRFIHQTPDGGYLLGFNTPNYNFGILRTSAEGDSLWSRSIFYDPNIEYERSLIYSITPTRDGGYFLAGRYGDWHGPGWRWARVDSNFDTLWTGQYSCPVSYQNSEAHAAFEMPEGGFMVAGSDTAGFAMIRLSSDGYMAWSRHFSTPHFYPYHFAECWAMLPATQGGFALAGFDSFRQTLLMAVAPDSFQLVETRPAFLRFDSTAVGRAQSLLFHVFNCSSEPYTVSNPSLSDSNTFTVTCLGPQVIPAGDSTTFLVTFRPQIEGAVTGTVAFVMPNPPVPSVVRLSAFGLREAANDNTDATAQEFRLSPNYPNPFNPETRIRFDLPQTGRTQLQIFDITGRTVATLLDGITTAGHHELAFNGSTLPSGVYFYHLQSGNFSATRKMLLLK